MEYNGLRIGQSIRDIRTKRGMTIEQLSGEVDKSVSHIHQIELGSRKMSVDLLLSLVSVLDTDANSVLGIQSQKDTSECKEKIGISIDDELDKLSKKQSDYLKGIFLAMIQKISVMF